MGAIVASERPVEPADEEVRDGEPPHEVAAADRAEPDGCPISIMQPKSESRSALALNPLPGQPGGHEVVGVEGRPSQRVEVASAIARIASRISVSVTRSGAERPIDPPRRTPGRAAPPNPRATRSLP